MANTPPRSIPANILDRMLVILDPHAPARDPLVSKAQLACGRWLAIRRLSLNLRSNALARAADLPPESLVALEAGLVHPGEIAPAAQAQLSATLARGHSDQAWMAEVVAVAAGRYTPADQDVVQRVLAELELLTVTDIAQDHEVFAVLKVLAEHGSITRHTDDILQEVKRQGVSSGIASLSLRLLMMRNAGWLDELDPQPDPDLPDSELQYYQLTTQGARVYRARMLEAGDGPVWNPLAGGV